MTASSLSVLVSALLYPQRLMSDLLHLQLISQPTHCTPSWLLCICALVVSTPLGHHHRTSSCWPRHTGSCWPRHTGSCWPRHTGSCWPRHTGSCWPSYAASDVDAQGQPHTHLRGMLPECAQQSRVTGSFTFSHRMQWSRYRGSNCLCVTANAAAGPMQVQGRQKWSTKVQMSPQRCSYTCCLQKVLTKSLERDSKTLNLDVC